MNNANLNSVRAWARWCAVFAIGFYAAAAAGAASLESLRSLQDKVVRVAGDVELTDYVVDQLIDGETPELRLAAGELLIKVWKQVARNPGLQAEARRLNAFITHAFLMDESAMVRERLFSLISNPSAGEPSLFMRPHERRARDGTDLASFKTRCMDALFDRQ